LYVLAQAEGNPLSRSELLQRAWPEAIDNPRTIDTHVLSLRKKIETDPRQPSLIQTVRNVGYRFNPEVLHDSSSTSSAAPMIGTQVNLRSHNSTSSNQTNPRLSNTSSIK
jgi:two-component system, OmpR family, response regulator